MRAQTRLHPLTHPCTAQTHVAMRQTLNMRRVQCTQKRCSFEKCVVMAALFPSSFVFSRFLRSHACAGFPSGCMSVHTLCLNLHARTYPRMCTHTRVCMHTHTHTHTHLHAQTHVGKMKPVNMRRAQRV